MTTRREASLHGLCVYAGGAIPPRGMDVRDEIVCGEPAAEGHAYCETHQAVVNPLVPVADLERMEAAWAFYGNPQNKARVGRGG